MTVLVTGSTGFLGRYLVPLLTQKGHKVLCLSRRGDLRGDVKLPNLGLAEVPKLDAIYHLASIVDLGKRYKKEVWQTNYNGTYNVLAFCQKHKVPRLYLVSTAYSQGRNMYELSKQRSEEQAQAFRAVHGLKLTIFKPSILVASSKDLKPAMGAFYQFVSILCSVHRRAEIVRRKVEGTLRLPVLEPMFRIKGDPEATLNLVPVDAVAHAIANIEQEGTFYLTNPEPPRLLELAEWVGDVLLLNIRFEQVFKPTPIEAAFQRITKAFEPYLCNADNFKSDLSSCPSVDKRFIQETVINSLLF